MGDAIAGLGCSGERDAEALGVGTSSVGVATIVRDASGCECCCVVVVAVAACCFTWSRGIGCGLSLPGGTYGIAVF